MGKTYLLILMTEREIINQLKETSLLPDAHKQLPFLVVRLLKENIKYYDWVGIYYIQDDDELVLGPFLGKPSPHTKIKLDSGVCGAAVREKETIIVDDVNADPRYLACSLETKSEIVVPIFKDDKVIGEIDIDSHTPAAFGDKDRKFLEEVCKLLAVVY